MTTCACPQVPDWSLNDPPEYAHDRSCPNFTSHPYCVELDGWLIGGRASWLHCSADCVALGKCARGEP